MNLPTNDALREMFSAQGVVIQHDQVFDIVRSVIEQCVLDDRKHVSDVLKSFASDGPVSDHTLHVLADTFRCRPDEDGCSIHVFERAE